MKSSPSFHIGSFCNFRRSFVLVCLSFLLVVSPRVGGQPGSSDESPCLQPSSPCRKSQSLHGNSLIRAPHRYIDLRSVSLSAGIRLDRDQQVFADRSPVEASPLVQQAVFDSRLSSSRRHIKRKLSLGVSDSKDLNLDVGTNRNSSSHPTDKANSSEVTGSHTSQYSPESSKQVNLSTSTPKENPPSTNSTPLPSLSNLPILNNSTTIHSSPVKDTNLTGLSTSTSHYPNFNPVPNANHSSASLSSQAANSSSQQPITPPSTNASSVITNDRLQSNPASSSPSQTSPHIDKSKSSTNTSTNSSDIPRTQRPSNTSFVSQIPSPSGKTEDYSSSKLAGGQGNKPSPVESADSNNLTAKPTPIDGSQAVNLTAVSQTSSANTSSSLLGASHNTSDSDSLSHSLLGDHDTQSNLTEANIIHQNTSDSADHNVTSNHPHTDKIPVLANITGHSALDVNNTGSLKATPLSSTLANVHNSSSIDELHNLNLSSTNAEQNASVILGHSLSNLNKSDAVTDHNLTLTGGSSSPIIVPLQGLPIYNHPSGNASTLTTNDSALTGPPLTTDLIKPNSSVNTSSSTSGIGSLLSGSNDTSPLTNLTTALNSSDIAPLSATQFQNNDNNTITPNSVLNSSLSSSRPPAADYSHPVFHNVSTNNSSISTGFNGTSDTAPLSLTQFQNTDSNTSITDSASNSNRSSSRAPATDYSPQVFHNISTNNFTIPDGFNGTGIPLSEFGGSSSNSQSSDNIGGNIDSALSHLGPEGNSSLSSNVTGLPLTDNNVTVGSILGSSHNHTSAALSSEALQNLSSLRTDTGDSSYNLSAATNSDSPGVKADDGFPINLPNSTDSLFNSSNSYLDSTHGAHNSSFALPINNLTEVSSDPALASTSLDKGANLSSALNSHTIGIFAPNKTLDHPVALNASSIVSLSNTTHINGTENNVTDGSLASASQEIGTSKNHTSVNMTLPSPAPAFVPVASLFTNPTTPPARPAPEPVTTPSTTNAPAKPKAPAPFPATWPRYIVPSNTPTSAPENSTLISILFSNSLNWPWLVTNSNASSQVLVFMPALISTSLNIEPSEVVTQSLQAYQPSSFNADNEGSMLTIWLGYIPSQYVDELQAMIRAPQSALYTQSNPIYNALAKTIDSSLPITTFSSQARAAQQAQATAPKNEVDQPADRGQKVAVIASVTGCGAAILAIGLFLAARQSKQKMTSRAAMSGSGGGHGGGNVHISSPMFGSLRHSSHTPGLAAPVMNTRRESTRELGDANGGRHPFSSMSFADQTPVSMGHRSSMMYNAGHANVAEPSVRYEYGHARTTSSEERPISHQTQSDLHPYSPNMATSHSADSSRLETRSPPAFNGARALGRAIHRKSDGSFGMEGIQRPGHRRLQITRGADGLVSGIGRPVMKENSLFF